MKNYPIIAIVGTSGSGKSRSIKNLDPATTVILNIENKSLPFKEAPTFKRNIEISDIIQFDAELDKALRDPTVKTVVIESFTSYCDALLNKGRLIAKGWDIYNFLNDKVSDFLIKIKNNGGKIIIIMAIDEVLKLMSAGGAESNQR